MVFKAIVFKNYGQRMCLTSVKIYVVKYTVGNFIVKVSFVFSAPRIYAYLTSFVLYNMPLLPPFPSQEDSSL